MWLQCFPMYICLAVTTRSTGKANFTLYAWLVKDRAKVTLKCIVNT